MFSKDEEKDPLLILENRAIPETIENICRSYESTDPFAMVHTDVSPNLWNDTGLATWSETLGNFQGTTRFAWTLLQNSITDVEVLHERQRVLLHLMKSATSESDWNQMQRAEASVLWLLGLPDFSKNQPLHVLFPQSWIFRKINHIPWLLGLMYIYRGYLSPTITMCSPATTILGPYFYLRRQLGFKIPITAYLAMLRMAMKHAMKPSWNWKTDLMKVSSIVVYLTLMGLSIYQSWEISASTRKLYAGIQTYAKDIQIFVRTALPILRSMPVVTWKCYGISADFPELDRLQSQPIGLTSLYVYITNSRIHEELRRLLQAIYLIDTLRGVSSFVIRQAGCLVRFDTKVSHQLWSMGHVSLSGNQVRNPVSLERNLIVTGPNAAGKTTYTKAICSNLILAQTFGIAYAKKAVIPITHAIGSFMRLSDELGKSSLFETEVECCGRLVDQAHRVVAAGQHAVFFLDEPMHSTPPMEGAATSAAVIEYLGKLPGVRVVTTTHHYALTRLSGESLFHNISMDAIETIRSGDREYRFPYRIRKGPSYQCIAIELLDEKKIPRAIRESAMKWKNKIYEEQIAIHAS